MKRAGPSFAVISTGDELLLGDVVDENSAEVSRHLTHIGLVGALHLTVGDDKKAIGDAIRYALNRADVVVTTGGLGPTDDDFTRSAVSELFSLPLKTDEEAEEDIRSLLSRIGGAVSEAELRQALIPQTAMRIPNEHGTASGFALTLQNAQGRRHLFCLSGVPFEMKQMLVSSVVPMLKREFAERLHPLLTHRLNTIGYSESELASLVLSLKLPSDVSVSYRASDYIVSITFYAEAKSSLEKAVSLLREAVEPARLLSEGDIKIQDALLAVLKERNVTVAVAESFTGGLVADRITDVAGVSKFFRGGVIAYSKEAKTTLLGVSETTIKEGTVYSEDVALKMAKGVKERFGTDYGLATTGVAGPSDASPSAPAGLCFLAVSGKQKEWVKRLNIAGDRRRIKSRAANVAINLLRIAVKNSL